jgi:hypothetical protein
MSYLLIGLACGCVLGAFGARSAYFNGVSDGFGFAVDPENPGHQRAAAWLRKYMGHRWPTLLTGMYSKRTALGE